MLTLKVLISSCLADMGKFLGMVKAFPQIWKGTVLDVGCRTGQLRNALPAKTLAYVGVDLFPPANVIANLAAGLPFASQSSDTVVALDVLEHTDDIHASFAELCRVARSHVLIILPNMYEVQLRMRLLFGRQLSGKYGLPSQPPKDRHRWLFSFYEAKAFTHALASRCGFEVAEEGCLVAPPHSFMGIRHLVRLFPNLFAPAYVALLRNTKTLGAQAVIEAVAAGNGRL